MDASPAMTTIADASRRMRGGALTPRAALEACLARTDQANGTLNAVVTVLRDGAPAPGADRGAPLYGIPFTVKDNIETAGVRTTASHPPLKDNVPDRDATVVARLKAAGAVLMGKTNLPRLAMDFQTDSPLFGLTVNPFDSGRTCGGSSGGSAAAVAAGMGLFSLGNDLLGSVRIPAHCCGVTGYVPTVGVIPRTGMIPQQPSSESVRQLPRMGVLARSVSDAAEVARVLSGPDGADTICVPVEGSFWDAPAVPRPPTFLLTTDAGGVPVSRDTAAAFDALVSALEAQGAVVRTLAAADFDFTAARLAFLRIFYPAIAAAMPGFARFLARRLGGMPFLDVSLRRFMDAEKTRRDLIQSLDALLDGADALLCPVMSRPAFPHVKPDRMNGPMPIYARGLDLDGRVVDYGTATVGFTLPFSTTGSPVVTVPIGSSADGLPIGAQVVGRRFGDAALLRTALAVEAAAAPLLHHRALIG
jgi:amidase